MRVEREPAASMREVSRTVLAPKRREKMVMNFWSAKRRPNCQTRKLMPVKSPKAVGLK